MKNNCENVCRELKKYVTLHLKSENNITLTIKKLNIMKIYDYYQDGEIYATFSENHERERRHFESLHICHVCKVSTL